MTTACVGIERGGVALESNRKQRRVPTSIDARRRDIGWAPRGEPIITLPRGDCMRDVVIALNGEECEEGSGPTPDSTTDYYLGP